MGSSSQQPLLHTAPAGASKPFSFVITLAIALLCSATLLLTLHLSSLHPTHTDKFLGVCEHGNDIKNPCREIVSQIIPQMAKDDNLLHHLLRDSNSRVRKLTHKAKLLTSSYNDARRQAALATCLELMDLSIDRLTESAIALEVPGRESDAHTWLSAVLTNHVTCSDELADAASTSLTSDLGDLILRARTILAAFTDVHSAAREIRREGEFPSWLSRGDINLLRLSAADIVPNVVVAQDGTGDYLNITDAVAAAPTYCKTRYVIYVKQGTYYEQVLLGKPLKNIMLVGDGMNRTIISCNLSVDQGSTTFKSATVAAVGDGFIAQDLWFKNTAGAENHQAVALRLGSDKSVINRCQIDAYQDTLYTHSNRQFYKECNITGTVDFIFGNAAVVFQNCSLVPRRPMANQNNMITAQGRTDPNQNTGITIQFCNISASLDLQPVMKIFSTYLGRPWKEYSRTVVMESYISNVVDPKGWAQWDGTFALSTLYYGEYNNTGPGSNTSCRVTWPGYHDITEASEVANFTVVNLIQGDTWLPGTGIAFIPGL